MHKRSGLSQNSASSVLTWKSGADEKIQEIKEQKTRMRYDREDFMEEVILKWTSKFIDPILFPLKA